MPCIQSDLNSTSSGPLFWPLRVKKNTPRVKKSTSEVEKSTSEVEKRSEVLFSTSEVLFFTLGVFFFTLSGQKSGPEEVIELIDMDN